MRTASHHRRGPARPTGAVLAALVGCGGGKDGDVPGHSMAQMHGLVEDAAWVWRTGALGAVDTGRAGQIDEAALVWARHLGEGRLELRQGATWGTGADYGHLGFDPSGGDLVLETWDLPGLAGDRVTGSGSLRMADAEADHGDRHVGPTFSCETVVDAGAATFFGTFDETVTLVCTGSASRPVGRWTFARGVGLVQLRSDAVESLDLVRPGW